MIDTIKQSLSLTDCDVVVMIVGNDHIDDIQTLLRKYIDKNKDDKEKMRKLKEAVKKLKETRGVIVPSAATSQQVNQIVRTKIPTAKPGDEIEIIRK
jgi:cell division septum initiation protein DivIVA